VKNKDNNLIQKKSENVYTRDFAKIRNLKRFESLFRLNADEVKYSLKEEENDRIIKKLFIKSEVNEQNTQSNIPILVKHVVIYYPFIPKSTS